MSNTNYHDTDRPTSDTEWAIQYDEQNGWWETVDAETYIDDDEDDDLDDDDDDDDDSVAVSVIHGSIAVADGPGSVAIAAQNINIIQR